MFEELKEGLRKKRTVNVGQCFERCIAKAMPIIESTFRKRKGFVVGIIEVYSKCVFRQMEIFEVEDSPVGTMGDS